MLVQYCVAVGTLVSPQRSHNIQATLSQCCGNIDIYVIFQLCYNVVTMLPECCSMVGFQSWAPMFTQRSHNIA